MKRNTIYLFVLMFILAACAGVQKSTTQSPETNRDISYKDLVSRLTDLRSLSFLPEGGEKSAMWASYDRKSKVDSSTGDFINWSANNDGLSPQFIRKEGENMVLAEMEGPGAIVRIWSASPDKGHIKIYIDGNTTPIIDVPFIDLFSTNSIPAFNYPGLVYETAARGYNNYVPISYQRSCKVIAEPGWGQYYQFNYIGFPAGTNIGKFESSPSGENAQALSTVNNFFENLLGQLPYTVQIEEEKFIRGTIAAGETKTERIDGAKAIAYIKAQVNLANKEKTEEALRKLVLQINWDDEKDASVWSPVGDFFGSAPGYNIYRTLPMGMTEDHMYSFWYMPFSKSATISLTNHFNEPLDVDFTIGLENLPSNVDEYGRFHAKWHRNLPPLQDTARWPDWTVLETEGKGRFLGMSLMVWNPKGGSCKQYGGEGHWWWGEGDEKFFVDDEIFPSTFGTGTEDYFGYAWCIPEYFSKAFHSQNRTEENMGYQSLNRWQIIDNVPFQKSFKGYMEKYFPDQWPTQYATVAYWYLNPGGVDPIKPTPVDELYGFEIPDQVYREPGAIEGESLVVKSNTGGYAGNNEFVDEKLFEVVSGHKVFVWNKKENAKNELVTQFNVANPGKFKIKLGFVKTPASGKFSISVNDETNIQTFNLHSDVMPGKPETINLGVFQLNQGPQDLKFEWLEPQGKGRQMLLDFIIIEPA